MVRVTWKLPKVGKKLKDWPLFKVQYPLPTEKIGAVSAGGTHKCKKKIGHFFTMERKKLKSLAAGFPIS